MRRGDAGYHPHRLTLRSDKGSRGARAARALGRAIDSADPIYDAICLAKVDDSGDVIVRHVPRLGGRRTSVRVPAEFVHSIEKV